MAFVVGETVGPYRITEQLGSGGMATVFKAYHAALDRYVAMKVLHPAFKEDPNFLARFQREARVVARLEHPNIVPVYDFSDHNGQPYLVMRYVEGETLKARLGRSPLSTEETLKVIHPVGAALMYAHGQGVLHRDIKPSNVMLTPKGDVFLTDFGLARIAQAGESTLSQDAILGTPQYISPEQARGERDLDARTDVYSLGVVVYELLVGRVPYQADTPYAVVHDHIFTPLPMPRSINTSLPEPLERFLLKALAKDRADRFQSVEEMIAGLNRAVDESGLAPAGLISTVVQPAAVPTVVAAPRPAASEQPSSPPVTRHPSRVTPTVWAGLGALIVIGIAAALLLTRPSQPPVAPAVNVPTDQPPIQPTARSTAARPDPARETQQVLAQVNELFQQGNAQVVQTRPADARDTFRRAAEIAEKGLGTLSVPGAPAEVQLHLLAAESWLASGHPHNAEPHFRWLVESAPEKAGPLTGLALTLLLQDRIHDALRTVEEAVAIDADLREAHAVKGCGLLKNGERAAALREFQQAAEGAAGPAAIPPWARLVLEQLDCRLER